MQAALYALLSLSSSCAAAPRERSAPPVVPRLPPEEIVVRTPSFSFHMGCLADETWPARADETRAALGQALGALLEDEDTVIPTTSRQLGAPWATEPMSFDVALRSGDSPGLTCDRSRPRLVMLDGAHPDENTFFACVLDRSFVRLEGDSALFRGLLGACGSVGKAKRIAAEGVFDCVSAYAVVAVLISSKPDPRESAVLEGGLREHCSTEALDWVSREWVKRVREEETAADFGARAGRELCGDHGP